MKKFKRITILTLLLLINVNIVKSAPPPNDDCENAAYLPLPSQDPEDCKQGPRPWILHTYPAYLNDQTTKDAKPTSYLHDPCANVSSADVWYRLVMNPDTLFYVCIVWLDTPLEIGMVRSYQSFPCGGNLINCDNIIGFSYQRGDPQQRYTTTIFSPEMSEGQANYQLIIVKNVQPLQYSNFDIAVNYLGKPYDGLDDTIHHCVIKKNRLKIEPRPIAVNSRKDDVSDAYVVLDDYSYYLYQEYPPPSGPNRMRLLNITGASTEILFEGDGPYVGKLTVTAVERVAIIGCGGADSPPAETDLKGNHKIVIYGHTPRKCWPDTFTVCRYDTVYLRDNCSDLGCAGNYYAVTWEPPTYLDNPSARNPRAVPTEAKNFPYKVTVDCGGGCLVSQNVVLKVIESPDIKIKFSQDTICAGLPVHMSVEVPPGFPKFSDEQIIWEIDGGAPIALKEFDHVFVDTGVHIVRVYIDVETACPAVAQDTVWVVPGGTPFIQVLKFDACKICDVSIRINMSGGTPPYQYDYDWDSDGIYEQIDAGPDVSHTYEPEGTGRTIYKLTVRVTDNVGCISYADTTFDCGVPIDFKVYPDNSDPCERLQCFRLSVSGGNPPFKYSIDWDYDGNYELINIPHPKNDTICYSFPIGYKNNSEDYEVLIYVVDALSCTASAYLKNKIPDETFVKDCCWDSVYNVNYLACIESYLPVFCKGKFSFYHYSKPSNPGVHDVISFDEKECALNAYKKADVHPLIFPINSEIDQYPELHKIQGFNRKNEEIKDFAGSVSGYIYYNKGYSKNVPENILRMFVLNDTTCTWEILESTWVNTSEKRVEAKLNFLSRIFTIMGYVPPAKLLDNCGNYPNPFAPGTPQHQKTTIIYTLTENASIDIEIFNSAGGLIYNIHFEPGVEGGIGADYGKWHEIQWDGFNLENRLLANGAYLARITAESSETGKTGECMWWLTISR